MIYTHKHLITRTIVKRKAWVWGAGSLCILCYIHMHSIECGLLLQTPRRSVVYVCVSAGHSREPCKSEWTGRNAVWQVDSRGKKTCFRLGAHWRHLANMMEWSAIRAVATVTVAACSMWTVILRSRIGQSPVSIWNVPVWIMFIRHARIDQTQPHSLH